MMLKRIILIFALIHSSQVGAESIYCAEDGYPRMIEKSDLVLIDEGGGDKQITALVPPKYEGEKLDSAYILVGGKKNISAPLAVQKSSVKEWKGYLVAFIHTEKNDLPITIEANYGWLCVTTLRQTVYP